MNKYIKIESKFDKEGHDIKLDIYGINSKQAINWLSNLLQSFVDNDFLKYDTIKSIVDLTVVPKDRDRNQVMKDNLDKALEKLNITLEEISKEWE